MDFEVIWTREASEDFDSIIRYIARDSQYSARSVAQKIWAVSESLAEFPLIGRMVPEIEKRHIRERLIYSYRLVYRIQSGKIFILAVIHGKRLLENIFDRFE